MPALAPGPTRMTTLPNISAPNICGASCQLREPVRGLFGRALATSQLWRGRSARFLSPASCAWRVPVQHRWMGHAGQGGSTLLPRPGGGGGGGGHEDDDRAGCPSPGSEHEKLFVRWSGRRSVMARIGRGAPGMPETSDAALSQARKGVTRAGTHPGHFQGTMGLDSGRRAPGFVPTRTNLLLRPVNRLPGGGI